MTGFAARRSLVQKVASGGLSVNAPTMTVLLASYAQSDLHKTRRVVHFMPGMSFIISS